MSLTATLVLIFSSAAQARIRSMAVVGMIIWPVMLDRTHYLVVTEMISSRAVRARIHLSSLKQAAQVLMLLMISTLEQIVLMSQI